MSLSFISIRRHPYEEPYHLRLVITASNGIYTGSLEYYCNADDLTKVGNKLMVFPEKTRDTFTYELGSPRTEDRCAFHLVLSASTLDAAGHCAIQITLNTNNPPPYDGSCTFSICTDPAAINRLGRLLKTFGELKHTKLLWSETEGDLLAEESGATGF